MSTETYIYNGDTAIRALDMYQADGTEPANVYIYDSGTAIEIWPSSKVEAGACYPDPPPTQVNNYSWSSGGNLPLEDEGWDNWGTGADADSLSGYNRVNEAPQMNDCFYINMDSNILSAPASWEFIGLDDSWPVHNTHSISWTTGTTPSTLHLGMYFSAWDNFGGTGTPDTWAYDAPTHSQDGWDGFREDDNHLGWKSPVQCLYGDRIQTGQGTYTIDNTSGSTVYWDVDGSPTYNFPLGSCESGTYLRMYKNVDSTGSYAMVDYRIATYGKTSIDYLKSTRVLIGITRNSYGPGIEKLVTCYAVDRGDSQYRYWQPFCGEINFSDTPGDQSATTIVSGESITIKIYKDIT